MKQRNSRLVPALILALIPSALGAQLPDPGVPHGVVRFDFRGQFRHYDSRFLGGATQDIFRDYTSNAAGADVFPSLAAAQAGIASLTGQPGYRLSIGRTRANGLLTTGTFSLGLALGLTSRITLYGNVPIVRQRIQIAFGFDSVAANAGFNPADPVFGTAAGQQQTQQFFSELAGAISTLASNLAAGVYDGSPAEKTLAQTTLAQAQGLEQDLSAVYLNPASPFVPLAGSAASQAIDSAVVALQTTLGGSLGVGGFAARPVYALQPLSSDDFTGFLNNPSGPLGGFLLESYKLARVGDAEAGAIITLIDQWNRGGHSGGLRVAADLRMRFPTGLVNQPGNLTGLGTGGGDFGLRLGGVLDLGAGAVGFRAAGGWEYRLARNLVQRVAPPTAPIPFANLETTVRRTRGAVLDLAVTPYLRLAPSLALQGGVRYWRTGEDRYAYPSPQDSLAGVSASVLGQNTRATLISYEAGLTYASPGVHDPAARGLPVEAYWTVQGPLSGSGGAVPKRRSMDVGFRLYARMF